jgi:hypothetical protein
MTLDRDDIEAIATRVVELLGEQHRSTVTAAVDVDARSVAAFLGVDRSYVYAHAHELGARRLGDGPKARLRFRMADVARAIPLSTRRESPEEMSPATARQRQQRPAPASRVPLLPIRGERGA